MAAYLQAWVRVYFDQPGSVFAVDHEIHAENLEIVHFSLFVDIQIICPYDVSSYFLHQRQNLFPKIDSTSRMRVIEIPLKF